MRIVMGLSEPKPGFTASQSRLNGADRLLVSLNVTSLTWKLGCLTNYVVQHQLLHIKQVKTHSHRCIIYKCKDLSHTKTVCVNMRVCVYV